MPAYNTCLRCSKKLDPSWKVCPYCQAQLADFAARHTAGRQSGSTGERRYLGAIGVGMMLVGLCGGIAALILATQGRLQSQAGLGAILCGCLLALAIGVVLELRSRRAGTRAAAGRVFLTVSAIAIAGPALTIVAVAIALAVLCGVKLF